MWLVQSAYKASPIFFKMFFDKFYRPKRYDAICNQIDEHQNINEFRSRVIQSYYHFPNLAIANLYLFFKAPADVEKEKAMLEQVQLVSTDTNILLEKAYMTLFWKMFRVEMAVNLTLFSTASYLAGSLAMGVFSTSVLRVLIGGGIGAHCCAMYMRRIQMKGL